ncbi:MAG: hypothetical protein ACOCUU_00150 [Nanoarchaeota archaeon]
MKKEDKIMSEVSDEVFLLMKKIQRRFNLSWSKAREGVSSSLVALYGLQL